MLHTEPAVSAAKVRAALPPHLSKPLLAAVRTTSGALQREAARGLELLIAQPGAAKRAVAVASHRAPSELRDEDVALFHTSTTTPAEVAAGLARLHRMHVTAHVAAYLPSALAAPLHAALLTHPDGDVAQEASDWALRMTPRKDRASYLLERLRRSGALEEGPEGPKLAPGADPVDVFASAFREKLRPGADYIAGPEQKAEAAKRASEIRQTGLTEDPRWKRSDPSGRRGLLAEHLRKLQLQTELAGTSDTVVQGILLVRVPPELRQATSLDEVLAYCDERGIPREVAFHAKTTDGHLSGLTYTEIDLTVLREEPGNRVRLLRFENVKAGPGHAKHADEQNQRAIQGLSHGQVIFLFPTDQGLRDRTKDLVHAASGAIELETVGPLGDGAYSKSYGVSAQMLDVLRAALSE